MNSRWMPYAKSDALMGVPSEYFMFGRSLSLYVLPSGEMSGIFSASAGTTWVPSLPLACLYVSKRGVDVPEHLPPLEGVGELRVDVVGERSQRDVDVATATATATTASALVTAARRYAERCHWGDADDGDDLAQCVHLAPCGSRVG